MSNWVGGLPPTPKSSDGGKKTKKSGRSVSPPSPPPVTEDGYPSRIFFGAAIPPTPIKMPKLSPDDLKPPPKVKLNVAIHLREIYHRLG